MPLEIIAFIVGLVIGVLLIYALLSTRILRIAEEKAREIATKLFEAQKEQLDQSIHQTYQAKFEEWKATVLSETIKKERQEAVDRARAVLKGKIGEQLAPLLPEFLESYNPSDARFIGSPIDYVIFKNLSKVDETDDPIEVVLLDVKTGEAVLSKIERRIKSAVDEHHVLFHTLRLTGPSQGETAETVPSEQTAAPTRIMPTEPSPAPASRTIFCAQCGKSMAVNQSFCPACGKPNIFSK